MATKKKPLAKKKFCVWADYVRRVHQHVEAKGPKQAYDIAKKRSECWQPCESHDNDAYRLSNEVQNLVTEEFVAVLGAKSCKTCGSELVPTVNDSNFGDGECGGCEYQRYKSQPKLLLAANAFLSLVLAEEELHSGFLRIDELQTQIALAKEATDAAYGKES